MAGREPRSHVLRRVVVQRDHGAAAVGGVFAALQEAMLLEVPDQLARGRQRQAELARHVSNRALALVADVREDGDVPPAERRLAVHEHQELR